MITELKEQNEIKSTLRFLLILTGVVIIISAIWIHIYVLFLGLYIILMSLMIRERSIQVDNDRFELNGKSIFKLFNSREIFEYSDIRKIEFSESYTDVLKTILKSMVIKDVVFIGNSGFGTHSKPDTITIIFKDGSFRVINRIGSRDQFLDCFKSILEEMNRHN